MTPPLSHMVMPSYAKSVTHIMAKLVTPVPQHRCKRCVHFPYIDYKAEECNDLDD
jgi:hypothetical protein